MKIKINNIRFGLKQVSGTGKMLLLGAAPAKVYKDGKATGEVDGTRYSVICPDSTPRYADLAVKVPGPQAIDQAAIDTATEPIEVTFEGFEGRFYRLDGANDYDFTAKADKIVIVSPSGKVKSGGNVL